MNDRIEAIFGVEDMPPVRRGHRRSMLPERLSASWRRLLMAGDFVVALCAGLLLLPDGARVAAPAFAGLVLAAPAAFGLYARSYAVHARDEVYFVSACCVCTIAPALALMVACGASLERSIATFLLASAGLCTLRAGLTAARRPEHFVQFAGTEFVGADAATRVDGMAFRVLQRAFDLSIAVAGTILLSPLMGAIALLVYFDSGAPVIFRQERVGRSGEVFKILKFRTMRSDADSNWARPGDRRITGIGSFLRRTSLDELPQLFNVLHGEMSIAGPRPEMRSFAADFARTIPHYDERHLVKPGITGWAQVYMKRNLDPSEIVSVAPYDLFYVENAGLLLNIVLVLKTAVEVIFHRAV